MKQKVHAVLRQLEDYGWTFTSSQCASEGDWLPADADWNYRDIPHLNFVHSQVSGVLIDAQRDTLSSLFVQKIGPFRVLLPVMLIAKSSWGQAYFTALGGFGLVIETEWKVRDSGTGCRVNTTYHVGSTKFLRYVQPLVHRILKRNYRLLMSEDLPMREARANLRRRGFTFRLDQLGYGYDESLRTARYNVIAPKQTDPVKVKLSDLPFGRAEIWNEEENAGVVTNRVGDCVQVFPAYCPHEGASLLRAQCDVDGKLVCPWHGRLIRPITTLSIRDAASEIELVSPHATNIRSEE